MRPVLVIVRRSLLIALAHGALVLGPWLVVQSAATAWLPYHSYFTVARVLHGAGLPVIAAFEEGMFMAPVTVFGDIAIGVAWCLAYVGLALGIEVVRRRVGAQN